MCMCIVENRPYHGRFYLVGYFWSLSFHPRLLPDTSIVRVCKLLIRAVPCIRHSGWKPFVFNRPECMFYLYGYVSQSSLLLNENESHCSVTEGAQKPFPCPVLCDLLTCKTCISLFTNFHISSCSLF